MAMIKLISTAQPVSDFSVSGALVTVAGLTVNCGQHYAAGARVVEIRRDAEGATVVGGDGAYLATIAIPLREYVDGENGRELVPLEPREISITLWPAA